MPFVMEILTKCHPFSLLNHEMYIHIFHNNVIWIHTNFYVSTHKEQHLYMWISIWCYKSAFTKTKWHSHKKGPFSKLHAAKAIGVVVTINFHITKQKFYTFDKLQKYPDTFWKVLLSFDTSDIFYLQFMYHKVSQEEEMYYGSWKHDFQYCSIHIVSYLSKALSSSDMSHKQYGR